MKRLLIVILFILVIPTVLFIFKKYRETLPIPVGAVSLEYPLKNGKYLVTASGSFWGVHSNPIEKYAVDILRFPTLGSFFKFHQADLEANETYNIPVYSPCVGSVKKMRDGIADQPIGIKNSKAPEGNFIIIGCPNFNVMMAHFKKVTFKIKEGDRVQTGEVIGQIGNSGNTDGPHLHIMAYLINGSTGEKTPLPITFNGRYFYSLDNFTN